MIRIRVQLGGDTVGLGLATHYFKDTTEDQVACDAARLKVFNFWDGLKALRPTYGTAAILPEAVILDPATGEATGSFAIVAGTVTGTGASEQLPFATQGLVRLRTGSFVNGREVKGRIFVPGPMETSNTAGVPIAAYITSVQSAATSLIGGGSTQLAVWARPYAGGSAGPARAGSAKQVTSAQPWTKWSYLRSRRD